MLGGVIAFFAAGVWALVSIDVLGLAASGMAIAAAVMFMIVVFGFLSRARPQFLAAAIMTFGALLAIAFATVLTHATVVKVEERIILQRKATAIGGTIVIYGRSDVGKHLGMLQAARSFDAGATGIAFCLLVYLAVRCFHRRPSWV